MYSCITFSDKLTLNSKYCLVLTSTGWEDDRSTEGPGVFTTGKKIWHHLHRDMGCHSGFNSHTDGTDLISSHSARLNFDKALLKLTSGSSDFGCLWRQRTLQSCLSTTKTNEDMKKLVVTRDTKRLLSCADKLTAAPVYTSLLPLKHL